MGKLDLTPTTTFAITFYLSPDRPSVKDPAAREPACVVADLWSLAAEEEFDLRGQFVSAVATEARAIDCRRWGAPLGGEIAVVVTGHFDGRRENLLEWEAAVRRIANTVRSSLEQQRANLVFNTAAGLCALTADHALV